MQEGREIALRMICTLGDKAVCTETPCHGLGEKNPHGAKKGFIELTWLFRMGLILGRVG